MVMLKFNPKIYLYFKGTFCMYSILECDYVFLKSHVSLYSTSCVPTNCDMRSGLKLSTGDRPAFERVWTFYYFSPQIFKLRIFI